MSMREATVEEIGDDVSDDYTDAAATFGDRLVRAREATGTTQAQLAHRLGIKLVTLRNWEEDRSEPRANKLQMVAGMLNVSMVWLMSGQGEAPTLGAAQSGESAETGLAELRSLRSELLRLAERTARLEKRLRSILA